MDTDIIKKSKVKPSIAGIDLFCGVGGLSHGLIKAGIKVRAGFDIDASCKFAYEVNNKARFVDTDICKVGKSDLEAFWNDGEIRVLAGCAPCQPFSTHSNKVKGKEEGDKWNLLNEFVRLIVETGPQIVSMENVPNLSNKQIFLDFVQSLEQNGYHVWYKTVYCPDYGIPQKRKRLVLLASRLGPIKLIAPSHTKGNYKTVKDAISHLESLKNGERSNTDPLHFTTRLNDLNLKRIRASVPNGTWEDWDESLRLECHTKASGQTYKSVYGRMAWDEPSPTITTQFYNYGTGRFGHPEQDRALTIREASILQSFPEGYKFFEEGKEILLTKIGVHIGNAVPVDLGYAIGRSIINHVKDFNHGELHI
jgi:DNA (cytosine-5)-methyltransferase 1